MSLFIETLRVEHDDTIPLLDYHKSRMTRALSSLGTSSPVTVIDQMMARFAEVLTDQPLTQCIRKYRVLYSNTRILEATLTPYVIRPINTLAIAPITFGYEHKYADRIEINACYHDYPHTDDVIMTRDDLLTDTSYGNIALHHDGMWYTPETPLLRGCRRQYLIDHRMVQPKKIRIEDIHSYSYLMIFNAMIPFGRVLLPTRHIHL